MAKQTAMILSLVEKKNWTFEQILIFLEHWHYVLIFQFQKACNVCREDQASIDPRKPQLEFLIK